MNAILVGFLVSSFWLIVVLVSNYFDAKHSIIQEVHNKSDLEAGINPELLKQFEEDEEKTTLKIMVKKEEE